MSRYRAGCVVLSVALAAAGVVHAGDQRIEEWIGKAMPPTPSGHREIAGSCIAGVDGQGRLQPIPATGVLKAMATSADGDIALHTGA